MAAEASRSSPSPDSYIGSLISLTSKSEIRYEGILYNINTEEPSIGLRNVRSFGTEGRKKDGHQIPAGDKIYEYILFRGSDIKDLLVKASAPVQTAPTYNDPAIIQSHYPHPPASSSSLPSLGTRPTAEFSSHTAQVGIQNTTFQGSLTPYPTNGNLGSTAPPLTAVPLYWQGYYASPSGLPLTQQPLLMRPLPGIPMLNTSPSSGGSTYPDIPLFPPFSSNLSLTPASLPSTIAPIQLSSAALEMSQVSVPSMVSTTSLPAVASSGSLPQNILPVVNSKAKFSPFTSMALQTDAQTTSVLGTSSSKQAEVSLNLVTPSQLIQSTQAYILPSSHSLEKTSEEVRIEASENTSKPMVPEPSSPEPQAKTKSRTIVKEPLLPLPRPAYHKPDGDYRGRGRGRGRRGNGYAWQQAEFTEDFDFSAMNEKFNKEEVWGNLGKSISQSIHRDEDDEGDDFVRSNAQSLSSNIKRVYVKDDFFDTLSGSSNGQSNTSRMKFSEQLKINTETFGNYPRIRPPHVVGRGHRGGGGGGGRQGRGLYHGSRGYGYTIRGGGRAEMT